MAAVGELSLESNSAVNLKTMFKNLFAKKYYSSTLELQKSAELHIPLRTSGFLENVDLGERIMEDIANSNGPLSTLVLGDSGTGKSWLALNLTKKLYDSSECENKIPVYIPLGRIEKMISQQRIQPSGSFRSDILFSYILNHRNHFPVNDWKLQNLYMDLCDCELILILDGYDELKVKSNLREENEWNTKAFKKVVTIFFCRPNALVDVDVKKMFAVSEDLPRRYVISPLEANIVQNYISRVPVFLKSIVYDSKVNDPWMMAKSITKDYPNWESAQVDSEYKYWFLDRLPELQGLGQNVFILTTICQLLPKLVETERVANENGDVTDNFMQKLQEICRTEVLLYDRLTEAWFKYQVNRMEPTAHVRFLYENRGKLHHYMRGYAQNLAMCCTLFNQGTPANRQSLEGEETLFWNRWTPWRRNSKEFHRDESAEMQLFPQDENDTNEDRLENFKFLRNSSLLRYDSGAKIFEFFHLSLFEYFLSREVFEKYRGALNYYSNWNRRKGGVYFLFNQNNINDPEFSGVLSMLVERAQTDKNFHGTLVEAMKMYAADETFPGYRLMASNAWKILKRV